MAESRHCQVRSSGAHNRAGARHAAQRRARLQMGDTGRAAVLSALWHDACEVEDAQVCAFADIVRLPLSHKLTAHF
jgi:hypothetical protein